MFRIDGIPVTVERYPDGTPRMSIGSVSDTAVIEWIYERDEEIILMFIARHMRASCANLILRMPYIPHARMDRVKNSEEVFTLKHFCGFVNSLRFDKVIVRDAHSEVSLAMLDNVVSEPVERTISELAGRLLDPEKDIIFYPDEGSRKRYSGLKGYKYAFGIKRRDWETGKIRGLDAAGDIPARPFNALIADDISSYGGTFLHSARKLKELGADKLYLYVTHCETSILEGELINSGLLEKIYTTDSIYSGDDPRIEVLGGKDDE